MLRFSWLFLIQLAWIAPLAAQVGRPITLADAVREARERNPQVAAAQARAEAALQEERAVGASRWPTMGAEGSWVRTDDPVAAFGSRLRQGRFTQADFDPARLNQPAPLTDWSAALSLSWMPLDLSRDASVRAARAFAEAAGRNADWAARVSAFEAEVRFLEAVGADLLLTTAESAVEAAEANLAVAERRLEEGLVTLAEVLQARAALASARTRTIVAEQTIGDARGRLALVLGWDPVFVPVPASADLDELTDTRPPQPLHRSDLLASEDVVRAARAGVDRAAGARLPRVQGFARLETHAAEAFRSTGDGWTLGVIVSVPVFSGFEVSARNRAAEAGLRAVQLDHDRRVLAARSELAEARRAEGAAQRISVAARAASEAAAEGSRLMRRRFEEGLSTTADLLAAEARAADAAAAAVNASLSRRRAAARVALLSDPRFDTLDLSAGIVP